VDVVQNYHFIKTPKDCFSNLLVINEATGKQKEFSLSGG
jgi:hypothetical protein